MSYRNTIAIHFNYDKEIVKKIQEIFEDETNYVCGVSYSEDDEFCSMMFSKQSGGCNFVYFDSAYRICELIKENGLNIVLSIYLDEYNIMMNIYNNNGIFHYNYMDELGEKFDTDNVDDAMKYIKEEN